MPNERKILKNLVNNDQKLGTNDAKIAIKTNADNHDSKKSFIKSEELKVESIIEGVMEVSMNEDNKETSNKGDTKAVEALAKKTAASKSSKDIILAIDEGDHINPHLMSEYAADIYKYLRDLEDKYIIKKDFMSAQKEIDPRMRSILINWLVQVHSRFHLLQETLFFAVSILDRYIQLAQIPKNKFQLVGVTSLWLASKCEEIFVPTTEDYLYVTDNAYTQNDIEKMELTILKEIDFDLNRPLHIHFLRRFSKAGHVDVEVHNLSKFLIELSISDYNLSSSPPSQVAAAALYLSRSIFDDADWDANLVFHTQYAEKDIMPVVYKLALLIKNIPTNKLNAVKNKYSSSKFFNISRSELLKSDIVLEFAARN